MPFLTLHMYNKNICTTLPDREQFAYYILQKHILLKLLKCEYCLLALFNSSSALCGQSLPRYVMFVNVDVAPL